MIKFICLLKRREGMSFEDFKNYYETRHSKLRATIQDDHQSGAIGYERRYLRPTRHPIAQPTAGVDYDCIVELTYPDRAALDADMAWLGRADIAPIYAKDEDQLFDRRYSRSHVVEDVTAG